MGKNTVILHQDHDFMESWYSFYASAESLNIDLNLCKNNVKINADPYSTGKKPCLFRHCCGSL